MLLGMIEIQMLFIILELQAKTFQSLQMQHFDASSVRTVSMRDVE